MKTLRRFVAALTPERKSAQVVGVMMMGCVALTGEQVLGECNINVPGVPDLDQKREEATGIPGLPNDGKMYCVPTSATDWFAYIANHGLPEVLDGPRDWQAQDNYNFVTNKVADVGELMGTDGVDGTNGLGQFFGTVSHLQATAPGAFTVTQAAAFPGLSVTPEMLYDALDNSGFVSMTLGSYKTDTFGHWKRVGGHIVALHRVQNGCSDSPALWWRNPSTGNSESMTQQATFSSQDSEMEEVTDLWATPISAVGVSQTMWRFLRYENEEKQRFLDSFMTITPLVALTTDDQWETIEVNTPSVIDEGEEGQDVEENSPNGRAFDWFDFHPLLAKVFYATTEDEDDSAVLYKYDPKLEHLREIMRLRRRTPIVFGRHGELYLVKDGAVTQLDTKQNSDRPAILRQFDLKGAMPEAMVYEDGADEVTLLFTEKRRLLTLSRDLSPVRERPLPSQVKFVGEGLMTNSSLDKKVWLASTKSQSFYQLNQIPGKDGQWQVEQTITLPGVNNPTSLQVSESGNLIVVEAGKVHEFAYDERTRRWTDAPKSYVAGMRTGKRLVLARSRTNFDAKWMTGPGWTNYEPEAIDETGETPDCPADLTGSTDPRNPMWGMPDGMVDAGDYTYFLKQYERGNLLVTDLTGSKDPQDLLRYGAPDGRLTAADVLYYHERHANSLGYCPEGKNSK